MEQNRDCINRPTQVWPLEFLQKGKGNSTEKGQFFQQAMLVQLNTSYRQKKNSDLKPLIVYKNISKWITGLNVKYF